MNKFGYNKEILNLLVKPENQRKEGEDEAQKKRLDTLDQQQSQEAKEERERNAVVSLRDIKVSENGQITKTNYFKLLEMEDDDYRDIKLTEEEARKVALAVRSMSTGLTAAIPLTCTGPSCPFKTTCPYEQVNQAPVGRPCPVEKQLIAYWTAQYVEEFDVNFHALTEVRMVAELAEFDIYEMRITKYLAENHPTLLQEVTSFDAQGNQIINLEISRAFDLKEKLKRSRMKVLEALMATRKDRAKIMAEVVKGSSTADKLDDLKKKLELITQDVGKMEVINADYVEVKP